MKKPTREDLKTLNDILTQYSVADLVDAAAYHSDQSQRQIAERLKCHSTVFTQWKNNEPKIIERLRKITAMPFED